MNQKLSFFAELKRRNVLRAAAVYAAAVWAFGQGLSQFSPALGLPGKRGRKRGRLEIGHVLFLDLLGYSKLLISEHPDLRFRKFVAAKAPNSSK